MNAKELIQFAPYIQAMADGRVVQRRQAFGVVDCDWEDMQPEGVFDPNFMYRIKPLPVLHPYSEDNDIINLLGLGVRVKSTSFPIYRIVEGIHKDTVNGKWCIYVSRDSARYTPRTLMNKYEFSDGKPLGIYVDEVPSVPVPYKKKAGKPDDSHEEPLVDEDEEPEDSDEEQSEE